MRFLKYTNVVPEAKILLKITLLKTKKAEVKTSAFVRAKGLEPSHLTALDPKSSVSTNSTTPAYLKFACKYT